MGASRFFSLSERPRKLDAFGMLGILQRKGGIAFSLYKNDEAIQIAHRSADNRSNGGSDHTHNNDRWSCSTRSNR